MENKEKNINKTVTKTATAWKARAKQDKSDRRTNTRAQSFALELMDYMDKNGIRQNELAQKMGVSAQQVNKILRAKSNLTFDTLDKVERALGVIITPPKIRMQETIHSAIEQKDMVDV